MLKKLHTEISTGIQTNKRKSINNETVNNCGAECIKTKKLYNCKHFFFMFNKCCLLVSAAFCI